MKPAILITVFFITILSSPVFAEKESLFNRASSGFTETTQEARETLKGIHEFLTGVSKFIGNIALVIESISSFIDSRAIAVFLIVLIISSGLTAVGVPRGYPAFITALLITDSLWFLWGKSMGADMLYYTLTIIRVNLIVLSPFIAAAVVRRYLFPVLRRFFQRVRPFSFLRGSRGYKKSEEFNFLSLRLRDESISLLNALSDDADSFSGKSRIGLSERSRRHIDNLSLTLERLKQ